MTRERWPLEVRFWRRVEPQPSGCWEWQGALSDGYGQLGTYGRAERAHRIAWVLHNQAEVPDGLLICHKCDNRRCCNPWHLYAGTYSDNQNDRTNWRSGDAHNRTRITDSQVAEARARYVRRSRVGSGTSAHELADEYGLTVPYFVRLMRGTAPRKVSA